MNLKFSHWILLFNLFNVWYNQLHRVKDLWSLDLTASYLFILSSCPQVAKDETLSILMNGEGVEAMFRIQMFRFVGVSYNYIFLHCKVQICHNTAAVCKPVSLGFFLWCEDKGEVILLLGQPKKFRAGSLHGSFWIPTAVIELVRSPEQSVQPWGFKSLFTRIILLTASLCSDTAEMKLRSNQQRFLF